MIYVIGSGLTGIATALALVKRGYRPTILDAGITPDPEALALKARLASVEPEEWASEDVARARRIGQPAASGIPRKLSFGSDFAYRDMDSASTAQVHRAVMLRSFARGGFSNVWGGVIQQLSSDELQYWPLSPSDLSPHYAAMTDLVRPSTEVRLSPSTQARFFYDDLLKSRSELEKRGIRFDYATLAVRTFDGDREKGCRHCGMCLYGCPYDSIFSSGLTLSTLVRQGLVSHISNVLVDRVETSRSGVRVEGRSLHSNDVRVFEGDAAFVATGLLESARIVLNSTVGKLRSTAALGIQQSDIFTLPMLRYRSEPAADHERTHTLCQLVLNIDDSAICEHPVHLQLYGYNDLYPELLAARIGPIARPLKRLVRSLSQRLFTAFGYLHSQVSSSVHLFRAGDSHGRIRLEGQHNPESTQVGRAIARKLFQSRRYLRTFPVSRELKFDVPGGGLRSGGCFPMRREPVGLETDLWGRVPGLSHVHVVDASVLPSIPAGPIAFTVMANAHRIATECPIQYVA